jgi:hypothetical protein
MISSLWKTVPVLSLVLSAVQAQELVLQELALKERTGTSRSRQSVSCGVVEGNDCFARSCSGAMGGAFEFDFLYWRAENQGFVSGWEVNNPMATAGTSGANIGVSAKVIRPEETWAPGFRFGAGWNSDYDRWDLFVDWTWYQNKADATNVSETGINGQGLYSAKSGLLATFDMIGPYTSLHTTYRLWHNCWDAELGRAFYITKKLSLRPHWGARAAINRQKGSSSFYGEGTPLALLVAATNPMGINDRVQARNKFWGIGPRTGVHANWHFHKGFSVIGKGAVALLYGQMKWRSKDTAPTSATNPSPHTWAKSSGQFQTLVPNLQMFLGLQWAGCFHCDEVTASFAAGWEANYWWNQYAVNTPPYNWATNNALTMEGLTVNIHIDY